MGKAEFDLDTVHSLLDLAKRLCDVAEEATWPCAGLRYD